MDFGDIARQRREMEKARQQGYEAAVQKRMQELGVSRELAEYLLGLETRIIELEKKA